MTAFTDHMERIHKYAPAPEDAVYHILTEQKGALIRDELARRMEAGPAASTTLLTEYTLILDDQEDRHLFLADWCAMYIPRAALAQALGILDSIGGE